MTVCRRRELAESAHTLLSLPEPIRLNAILDSYYFLPTLRVKLSISSFNRHKSYIVCVSSTVTHVPNRLRNIASACDAEPAALEGQYQIKLHERLIFDPFSIVSSQIWHWEMTRLPHL